jgi:hypothetical protein
MSPLYIGFSGVILTIFLIYTYVWYYTYNKEEKESFEILKKTSVKNNILRPIFIGKFLIDESNRTMYYCEPDETQLYVFPIECIIKIKMDGTGSEVRTSIMLLLIEGQGDELVRLDCKHCNYKNVLRYLTSMNPSLPVAVET